MVSLSSPEELDGLREVFRTWRVLGLRVTSKTADETVGEWRVLLYWCCDGVSRPPNSFAAFEGVGLPVLFSYGRWSCAELGSPGSLSWEMAMRRAMDAGILAWEMIVEEDLVS